MANTEWEKVYQIKGLPVKFVWRGSPYNDLKATVEGGNRDYVAVARIVASSPISQAEAEKLASEKWRQIKKTARNANAACNAKFKVGDKVRLSDSHPRFPGSDAVVTRVFPTGFIKVKVDGADDIEVAERLISANSLRSRNAVVQKALNASRVARNGYVVLRTASGGTARVYEGEEVEYDGKSYKAAALGSPSMAEATLVDGAGNKIVVRMRDPRLKAKASNAVEARYATPVGG